LISSRDAFEKVFRSITDGVCLSHIRELMAFEAPNFPENLPTPYLGLWERIMIGLFLIWIVVLAAATWRAGGSRKNQNI
jgi:hypothetical protein